MCILQTTRCCFSFYRLWRHSVTWLGHSHQRLMKKLHPLMVQIAPHLLLKIHPLFQDRSDCKPWRELFGDLCWAVCYNHCWQSSVIPLSVLCKWLILCKCTLVPSPSLLHRYDRNGMAEERGEISSTVVFFYSSNIICSFTRRVVCCTLVVVV